MRIVWQHVRDQMLKSIHEAGFVDFTEAHFGIFSYPLPNGVRPSDLARQKRMSRQAVNYLIVQLEGLGYLERRSTEGSDRRLVYLSLRGQDLADTIFSCLGRLHEEWADEVSEERFEVFLDVLRELSTKAQSTK